MSLKTRALVVLLVLFVLGAVLVFTQQSVAPTGAAAGRVTIGGKQFTEQEVLGQIMAILIERHTDIDVRRKLNLGGTMICFNAIKSGDLDLYVEYTGTGLVNILDRPVIRDPDQAYEAVAQAFEEQFDLVWLEPFGFNNTYTLTMRRDHARELGIETISDLAAYINGEPEDPLKAAFDAEFLTRPDGYDGLCERYGFTFASEPMQMDPGLMYRAVSRGSADVIDGFATDGRIAAYDLVVLEDDKGFFPPYYAAPLVRRDTLERLPQLQDVLNRLAGRLSDDKMQQLNYEADEKGRKAKDIALEFLQEEGLVEDDSAPAAATEPQ